MLVQEAVVICVILSVTVASELDFPPGFKFGVASAAYQIEGGWNVSDKSESIWDHFTHTHSDRISDHSNGDVSSDSYHFWRRDIQMLEELGVDFYRFSISWSRLLPTGFPDKISEDGRKYYSDLIDAMLEQGIEPMLTLYHWDLPLRLHKLGGWLNPLVSDWFADYARVVFKLFAGRIKTFLTVNEPLVFCDLAYNSGAMAPGIVEPDVAPYICNKHALIAHAKAYRIYDEEFRDKYHGRVSLSSLLVWFEPYTKQDEHLAELVRLNEAKSFHAVFSKEGGWPSEIEKIIGEKSKKLGFPRSNLPPFTKEEIDFVKGTFDFYAMNYYTTALVRPARPGDKFKIWPSYGCEDLNAIYEYDPLWNTTSSDWFYSNPPSIRKQLKWIKDRYGDIEIIITENGYPTTGGRNDQDRLLYFKENLHHILLSIKEDGVNITGYTAWALMDNFEWPDGYKSKFGLYEVDFNSVNKTHTARASALFYRNVIAAHSLDVPNVYVNDTNVLEISNPETNYERQLTIVGVIVLVLVVAVVIAAYVWRARRRLNINIKTRPLELSEYTSVKTTSDYSVIVSTWGSEDLTFPPGFRFGVATSAYQIEGAWNVSDKGESIWDRFTHARNDRIKDGSNGDIACDSYHLWKRDVEMVEALGVHFYRFSIAWTRILPTGFTNHISEDGKKYYSDLIDALLEKGIEPVITLYHWDLPLQLQKLGGWTNPLVSDWFADYARVVYSLYADRVKTWFTINEPIAVCDLAYNVDRIAPGILSRDVGYLLCGKNVLIAHAKAWRVYDEEFRPKYKGRIAITNHLVWVEPKTAEDKELTDLAFQHFNGRYCHPIFTKEGGWPPSLEKYFEEYSKKNGYFRSTLPVLNQKEIELIRGTYDFFAFNMYTSRLVMRADEGEDLVPWPLNGSLELGVKLGFDPAWGKTEADLYPFHPEGLRKLMSWLKSNYGDLPYFIAENGLAGKEGLEDSGRIVYIRDYLKQILLSIKEDKVNVTGYTMWSLMDNFEWPIGYLQRFGLYEVDFKSPQRTRTPRASALYYTDIIKAHSLDVMSNLTVAKNAVPPKSSKDTPTTSSYNYNILIGAGLILVVALIIIAGFSWNLRQRKETKKETYLPVNTDEREREKRLTQ